MLLCLISDCPVLSALEGMWFVQVFISVFFAILFLQSGIDKVSDRKGNLEWLKGHFAESPLAGMVPLLLTVITLAELLAGSISAIGVVEVVIYRSFCFSFIGTTLATVALVMLFLGQRLAKDYEGAGNLVPYFIVAVINLYFLV